MLLPAVCQAGEERSRVLASCRYGVAAVTCI